MSSLLYDVLSSITTNISGLNEKIASAFVDIANVQLSASQAQSSIGDAQTGTSDLKSEFDNYDDDLTPIKNAVDSIAIYPDGDADQYEIGVALAQAQTYALSTETYMNTISGAISSHLDILNNQVLNTAVRVVEDSSVTISADEVVKFTPNVVSGSVTIDTGDSVSLYGSCIMFITLGASNAVTFYSNGNTISPLDSLVANKTNQCIIEIIGNGTTNDIKITVVRSW